MQNAGGTPFHNVGLENKRESGWPEYPKLVAPGLTLAKEGRAYRIYEAKLAGEISHTHQAPTVAFLVSGNVTAGTQKLDEPGEWVFIPAGQPHKLASNKGEARLIEIEVK